MAVAALMAFFGGLLTGSFITVVAHRVPRGESIVGPRSRCPGCGTQIAAYDNVPVFSWLVLRGRARCCGAADLARYPLTELALALLYAATVLVLWDDPARDRARPGLRDDAAGGHADRPRAADHPQQDPAGRRCVAVAHRRGERPGQPARAARSRPPGRAGSSLLAALAYPRGMGLGDVKLAATMGLFLGRDVAPALLVALLAGSLVGLAMIARHGAAARKQAIPFGPFLAFGGVVGLLPANELIDWYLGTFS